MELNRNIHNSADNMANRPEDNKFLFITSAVLLVQVENVYSGDCAGESWSLGRVLYADIILGGGLEPA